MFQSNERALKILPKRLYRIRTGEKKKSVKQRREKIHYGTKR